ncbi:hypothetical protein FFF34_003785 [Inquilinus sp. KBS0705]|nr:hypothetical protein FFF34_003785 [Inquilinus sp. KBS0705]
MKKILLGFLCMWFAQTASAQKDSLQFDENNNYVYYHVVDKPGFTADTLYNRSRAFTKAFKLLIPADKKFAPNSVDGKGKFLVYNGPSMIRKETGAISYTLFIETKEGKYRYKLSDFLYTPYVRDRFNNMVPVAGLDIPLEKLQTKYGKKEADAILAQAGAFSISTANKIKEYMDKVSNFKKAEPVKKVATDKW